VITLFTLVPNPQFMNAMSFAINGNISLSRVDFSPQFVSFKAPYLQYVEWGGLYALVTALLGIVEHEGEWKDE